ncbi:50S ribosomal protein L1 [Fimbriiglobus ruber]|uniref:Large ribosomal subunit protein uL1 n=1 Tax=Fimbriiglobus ruber TaxID=1908690 RepID=A0A225DFJ3_9BACT|nr:50S ribosomal protein L1 [Fimbriiglobus ruber]OWK35929.1 LSU ribosomal protein L1p (L10Ae) [Fimbriiglobus ruber]
MAKEQDTAAPAATEEKKPVAEQSAPVTTGGTPAPAPAGAAAPADNEPKKKKSRPGKSPRRGKKLRNHLKNLDQKVRATPVLPVKQAVTMLKGMKRAKFDETIEVHMNLGIDSTQSDQMVRGSVALPNGIGKSVRVAVFCQGDNVAKAKAAGADVAGGSDLVEKVQKEGYLDFDVAIATQDMMGLVSRLGKVLGPRGLMPTPKAGTVVPANGDIAGAVREFKAGKVEYRSDKTGQIHAGVGKMSFDDEKLVANITTFVETVRAAKPSGVKGNFINGIVISATMCPGIRMSV